jgi:hypothetical protein
MDSPSDNKYIISEFLTIDPDVRKINEAIEKGVPIIVPCILQKANTLNRNGRVYPTDILKREVAKYMELVKDRTSMGELDHPDSAVISLTNVSHLVAEMWWEGETLHGKIQIVDTPAGDTVKGLLKSGVKLGISSRGVGSVKKDREGRDVVQEDFELIGFDIVSSPSTPGAYLFKESKQWGMKKLIDSDTKPLRADDVKIKIKNMKSNMANLAKDDFWR